VTACYDVFTNITLFPSSISAHTVMICGNT